MNALQTIRIQDIEGYQIGNAEYEEHATGVTVILPKGGAVTGNHRRSDVSSASVLPASSFFLP